jgi:hypothetical protein
VMNMARQFAELQVLRMVPEPLLSLSLSSSKLICLHTFQRMLCGRS